MGDKRRSRVFVGDVHGCLAELDDLLSLISYKPKRHELWFVGDLVNRGPDSLGVLRRVRELGASAVVGNHDLHLIGRAEGGRRKRDGDTLKAVLKAKECDDLVAWLRRQQVIAVWKKTMLVHGGLHPRWGDPKAIGQRLSAILASRPDPLKDKELAYAVGVRYCDVRGRMPTSRGFRAGSPKKPFRPWDSWYRGDRTVVFGHWAQRGLVIGDRVRGLDTGCVYGGRLTAWIDREDGLVSVPAHGQYVST
jgi:bis(5'-nucleosyl)-tetraphosphatase (symmetrical)